MDPSLKQLHQPAPSVEEEEDEWDTEGFVIPSLAVGDSDNVKQDVPEPKDFETPVKAAKEEEKIYLGPHGAPPSQAKQQELRAASRKQSFKSKLKEADRKYSGTGRENKVENLRELVGSKVSATSTSMQKSSTQGWLDPHCHEAQFERCLQ